MIVRDPYTTLVADPDIDRKILDLWDSDLDTVSIAKWFNCPESQIANRLPAILKRRRVAT